MKTPLLTAVLFLLFTVSSRAQVFHENFEVADSVTSWTNGGPGWAPNSRIPYSGSFFDSVAITGIGDTIMLTTNPFSTLGMGNVYLYFHHIAKIEFFDGGILEISVDSGLTWEQLKDNAGNPAGLNNCQYYGESAFTWQGSTFQEVNFGAWVPGTPQAVPSMMWWRREIFRLFPQFSNLPDVRLRFVLIDRDSSGPDGRAGWFMDDIFVSNILDSNLIMLTNWVQGRVFVDLNSNLVKDSLERYAPGQKIDLSSGPYLYCGYTGDSGRYYISHHLSGAQTVVHNNIYSAGGNYYNVVPISYPINITAPGQHDSLPDFALQPTGVFNDLNISLYGVSVYFAYLSNRNYYCFYQNEGTTNIPNSTIVLYPDSRLTFDSSDLVPTAIFPDSIIWNIGNLAPLERRHIRISMHLNQILPAGTQISSNVRIEPIAGDANPVSNYDTCIGFSGLSWDPNEIMVNMDEILTTSFPNVPELEYVIRFQNTGNDTARVVNVLNYIPAELDFSTFQMMASTHDVVLEYNPINRLMKFKFDNIMLPDSTTNEPESHGIVSYRIKPDTTLQSGDTIFNQAHIYFDYNPVVNTNFATTAIVDPMFIHSNYPTAVDFQLMPNPVGDVLFIELNADVQNDVILQISDISGKAVAEHRVNPDNNNHQFSIDCSKLPNGVYFVKKISASGISVSRFVKIRR